MFRYMKACSDIYLFDWWGFEVRSFYLSFYPPTLSFPWKLVWQWKVPPRVAFFSWSASLGKILTIDNLCRRSIIVLDWCYMCKRCGESVDHLLLHWPIAYLLMSCGLWCFVCLDSIGLCLLRLLSCLSLGKVNSGDIAILFFGDLCHITWCGVFGEKGMLDTLRDVSGPC